MSDEDYLDETLRLLREVAAGMTEVEKAQAKLLAKQIKAVLNKKDHEGKQTFSFEDYSQRN